MFFQEHVRVNFAADDINDYEKQDLEFVCFFGREWDSSRGGPFIWALFKDKIDKNQERLAEQQRESLGALSP